MHTKLRLAHGLERRAGDPPALARSLFASAATLACAAVAVHAFLPTGGASYLADAAILSAAAPCALRAARGPRPRAGWLALALAAASLGAGAVASTLTGHREAGAGFVSTGAAGYLGCYALAAAALVLLARPRARRRSWPLLLDAVVAALTVAALVTALGLDSVIHASGAGRTGYPLLDLLLLALVAVVAVWQGFRLARESALASAGVSVLALTDAFASSGVPSSAHAAGHASDAGLLAGALLIGAAACVARAGPAGREAHQRWVAAVAPAALAFGDVLLLVDGRFVHHFGETPMALARLAVLGGFVRVFVSFVATQRMLANSLRDAASDVLTGLANRRALVADSAAMLFAPAPEPHVLAIYDLDGFKHYNDTFGHEAGDRMLAKLGQRAAAAVAARGRVYRLGGDEFCLVFAARGDADALLLETAQALTAAGPGFAISPSYGAATIPGEARDLAGALRLADSRMYAHKSARTPSPGTAAGRARGRRDEPAPLAPAAAQRAG